MPAKDQDCEDDWQDVQVAGGVPLDAATCLPFPSVEKVVDLDRDHSSWDLARMKDRPGSIRRLKREE